MSWCRRGRKVPLGSSRQIVLHRAALGPDDTNGFATSRELTLLHCLRSLPFDEALAVADSALRSGEHHLLARVAREARGPNSPQIRRVARLASELAANPFESALRAICLDVPGLRVQPQIEVLHGDVYARADLVDRTLRLALEADSFEWHGGRQALARDAHRYNLMAVAGWLVLRFSWDEVMFRPERVEEILVLAVKRRTEVRQAG